MKINVGMVWFNKDTKKFYLERDLDLGASFIVPTNMNISGEDVINVDDLITAYNTSKWVSMPIMEFMLRYADSDILLPDLLKYLQDNDISMIISPGGYTVPFTGESAIFNIIHTLYKPTDDNINTPGELLLGKELQLNDVQRGLCVGDLYANDDIKETVDLLVVKDIQCLIENMNTSPVVFDKLKICFFNAVDAYSSDKIRNYIKYNLLYTKNRELEEALWLSKDRKGDKRAMRVWADAILSYGGITENELDLAKIVAGLYEKYRD